MFCRWGDGGLDSGLRRNDAWVAGICGFSGRQGSHKGCPYTMKGDAMLASVQDQRGAGRGWIPACAVMTGRRGIGGWAGMADGWGPLAL